MTMRVRFDRTAVSVVAVCDCGWRTIAGTTAAADVLATAHVMAGHTATERLNYLTARRVRAWDQRRRE